MNRIETFINDVFTFAVFAGFCAVLHVAGFAERLNPFRS